MGRHSKFDSEGDPTLLAWSAWLAVQALPAGWQPQVAPNRRVHVGAGVSQIEKSGFAGGKDEVATALRVKRRAIAAAIYRQVGEPGPLQTGLQALSKEGA